MISSKFNSNSSSVSFPIVYVWFGVPSVIVSSHGSWSPLTLYARMSAGQTPSQAGAVFDAAFQGCCALLAPPVRLGKVPDKAPNDPNAAGTRSHIVTVDASMYAALTQP